MRLASDWRNPEQDIYYQPVIENSTENFGSIDLHPAPRQPDFFLLPAATKGILCLPLDDADDVIAIMAEQFLRLKEIKEEPIIGGPLRLRVNELLREAARRPWFVRAAYSIMK